MLRPITRSESDRKPLLAWSADMNFALSIDGIPSGGGPPPTI
jgi:hypothetical protein